MPTYTDIITEGSLVFQFAANNATKYDGWAFYKEFQNGCAKENKAVDFLFVENNTAWLIEVKDYRTQKREKELPLEDEMSLKVRDTLAGLAAATFKATGDEQKFAIAFMQCQSIKIILHCEVKESKTNPAITYLANLQLKLKRHLKAIVSSPLVVNTNVLSNKICYQVI